MKISKILSVLSIISLFCVSQVEAAFSNNGRFESQNLNLSVKGTLDNSGALIGSKSVNLTCETLSGNGVISGPQVTIEAKIFAYTGTISCEDKCVILTSQPFDENMFSRKGSGEFIILVNEMLAPRSLQVDLEDIEYQISNY